MEHLVRIGNDQVILSDALYETHLISEMDYLDKEIELCIEEAINWDSRKINASIIAAHFDAIERLIKQRKQTFADLTGFWRNCEN